MTQRVRLLTLQCRAAEQVSTQVCRHRASAARAADGVPAVRRSVRHGRRATAALAAETPTAARQELGNRLVARQRRHVPRRRHRVATQPTDACSYLRRR